MFAFIVQYSVFFAGGALLLVAGLILFRKKPSTADIAAFAAIAAAILIAWYILRPHQSPHLSGEWGEHIGQGKPALLQFYSPYSVTSMRVEPVVDMVEAQYYVHLNLVRIDMNSVAGRDAAALYNVTYTPTFIFLNGDGSERWRSEGSLDVTAIRDAISQP